MKATIKYCGSLFCALLITVSILVASGCSKGEVPNSTPEEIESAKFDAEQAENPSPLGASIPPD